METASRSGSDTVVHGIAGARAWAMTVGLLVSGLVASPAEARYPERPVRIVVPYAAGGGADLLARVLAQELSLRTKRQCIVENRTGGGTIVGTRAVIGAAPDGYTLLMTQTSLPVRGNGISWVRSRQLDSPAGAGQSRQGDRRLPQQLVVEILASPEVRDRLFSVGFEIIASTPKELAERIEHDIIRWRDVARRAGVIQPMNSTKDVPATVVSTETTKPPPYQKMSGTYRLVSSTRTLVDTGQVIDSFGKDPTGFIMYAEDGRMMVLIVRSDRPKPTHANMTDQQRADLFRSMAAYAGRYTFDGKKIVHHIDVSWNEILTGKDVVREIEVEPGGHRLIYRSGPGPAPTDGRVSIGKLVWEKVN